MPTIFHLDHFVLSWWHGRQNHRKWWCLWPIFPVSNGVKQGSVLAPMLFSLLVTHMLSADGNFFNLCRLKSCTKITRTIVRDFLFANDCVRGLTRACRLLRHCSKDVWVDSEHQENWGVETAGPKHCSAPIQHLHEWQPTQECWHIHISWQLHKFYS